MTTPPALHSSKSQEHLTPAEVVEAGRSITGGFDLDPATTPFANRLIRAERIYTRADDGLVQPWAGRVFLNPPGGTLRYETCGTKSEQALWWGRLAAEHLAGNVPQAIFVGFSLELLQSAQELLPLPQPLDFACCIPKKRIRFERVAEDMALELEEALRSEADPKKRRKLEKRLQDVLADVLAGVDRISGDQPSHGSLVVGLGVPRAAFRSAFEKIGICY